jgi:rfaE bifunctional protein nucleotidyltransferase chain/domain
MKSDKIITVAQASDLTKDLQKSNKKVVFTNGCFDLIHPGHVDYLRKAKACGDILIIGLNSDASIQRLKGKERPINDFYFRSTILAALEFVDYIVKFEDDTPLYLIKQILPNILIKGSDYTIDRIVGAKEVLEKGGEVKTIDFLEGFSSTLIINKIKNLNS